MATSRSAVAALLRWVAAMVLVLVAGGRTGVAVSLAGEETAAGFAVPQPGRAFVFPRDHGSHPEFRIEWWYVTGHLWDGASNRFGFQVTFFRRAAPPAAGFESTGTGAFGSGHLFLAHVALLEVAAGRFLHQERLNREGWDAGAETNTLRVWNGNWSLAAAPAGPESFSLRGSIRGEAAIALTLEPGKPLVVFGTNGVSRKGAAASAASHYLTYSRLAATGSVSLGGTRRPVRGLAWMDHEFSSSQLDQGQVGWDWASIQLKDGRDIMAYRMRREDGTTDPFSTLAWIDAVGRVSQGGASTFDWSPRPRWQSPHTGAEYPSGVRLTTQDPATGREVSFRLEPLARHQELAGAISGLPYWEGACRVRDGDGTEVGSAYLELTGYAGGLGARLR